MRTYPPVNRNVIPQEQGIEMIADPRYTIRSEHQMFSNRKTKIVYRAFFCDYVIGEIQPSTHREAVVDDLNEFRRYGGFR